MYWPHAFCVRKKRLHCGIHIIAAPKIGRYLRCCFLARKIHTKIKFKSKQKSAADSMASKSAAESISAGKGGSNCPKELREREGGVSVFGGKFRKMVFGRPEALLLCGERRMLWFLWRIFFLFFPLKRRRWAFEVRNKKRHLAKSEQIGEIDLTLTGMCKNEQTTFHNISQLHTFKFTEAKYYI